MAIGLFNMPNVNAQCVPDPAYTEPGIYPKTSAGFPKACVGNFFETVITNIVPIDTTILIFGIPSTIPFDSVVIKSVTGLPSSMTYDCSSSLGGCSFAAGEAGCVLISGTPTAGEVGLYNPLITIDAYLGGSTTPSATEVLNNYTVIIYPAGECSASLNSELVSAVSLFPNPAENRLTIQGLKSISAISILNMNGQTMNIYSNVKTDEFEMDVTNLEKGVYFVKIESVNSVETIRFVKR